MAATTKQRINVSVDAALLREARAIGLNISAVFEQGLRQKIAERRRRDWLAENREAFEDANRFIERYGLWSDGLRLF